MPNGWVDKALQILGGRPLLAHAIERLKPQVAGMVINANGEATRFAAFRLPVIADSIAGFAGPLIGVYAGLAWVRAVAPASSMSSPWRQIRRSFPPIWCRVFSLP